MSRSWQPDSPARGGPRPASPYRAAASKAAEESKAASHASVATAQVNSQGQRFGNAVALSERRRQVEDTARKYGPVDVGSAKCVDHRTMALVHETAKQLKTSCLLHASVADGTVTRDQLEALINDDDACRIIEGLSIIRSCKSSAVLALLFEALVRDPAAYAAYLKKEAELNDAKQKRLERQQAAEVAAEGDDAEAVEDEEPLDEDLGQKPPRPTLLKPAEIAVVGEAGVFSDAVANDVCKYVETSSVRALKLVDSGLTGSAAGSLCSSVLQSRSLTALDLSENGLGRDEEPPTERLAQVLQESKFLLDVNFADNDLNPSMVKALAEALATSDTRVPTPEMDPEPEFEPWVDELPEADEAPQQKVGYPEEEEAAAPAEEEADAAPATDEKPKDAAEADDGDGDDEEQEEKEADAAAADEEEELDDEERERLEEERREAERIAHEEAVAAWREREEQYIWGPQRAHMEYDEHNARRAVMQAHIDETAELKKAQYEDRGLARKAQLERERKDRERRSGWSHLTALSLAGNPMASEGAIELAAALRHEIPLPQDATEAAENDAEDADDKGDVAPADDEEDDADNEEHEEAAEGAEELPADEPADQADKPAEVAPTAPKTKPGFRTLRSLNISRASIGAKGMKALADVIAANCPSLETLDVTRNKFALKHTVVPDDSAPVADANDGEEEDEPAARTKRVPLTDWVSPGVEALAACVASNQSLRVLRVGHNHFYPKATTAFFAALRNNATLSELVLDGNPLFHDRSGAALDLLCEALPTMNGLKTLSLASTGFGDWLQGVSQKQIEQLTALFAVRNLDLSANNIGSPAAWKHFVSAARIAPSPGTKCLRLERNNLSPKAPTFIDDLCALAAALSRRIEVLSLAGNSQIGDEALRALMRQGFETAPSLKTLNLRGTRGTDIAEAFNKLLHNCGVLHEVDLGDCAAPATAAETICSAAVKSASLKRLSLWSRTSNLGELATKFVADNSAGNLTYADFGLTLAHGEEPTVDDDLPYEIEDVAAATLANLRREATVA